MVMYIGMAPLTSLVSIISEEREKHTLKALFFSDVKAREYLPGIGICSKTQMKATSVTVPVM